MKKSALYILQVWPLITKHPAPWTKPPTSQKMPVDFYPKWQIFQGHLTFWLTTVGRPQAFHCVGAGSNFTIYATIQRVNMVRVYSCVTLQTNKLKGHFSSAGMRKKDTLLKGPSKKKKIWKQYSQLLWIDLSALWYDTAASHWGTNTLSDSTEDRETGNWEERQCVPWRLYNRNIGLKWHFFFFYSDTIYGATVCLL